MNCHNNNAEGFFKIHASRQEPYLNENDYGLMIAYYRGIIMRNSRTI